MLRLSPNSCFRLLLTAIFSLGLCGCSIFHKDFQGGNSGLDLPLLAPSDFPQHIQVNQALSIKSKTRSAKYPDIELLALWSVRDTTFQLTLLTTTGQPILSALFDGKQVIEKSLFELPPGLSAQHLLSQIQMAYWPSDRIQSSLQNSEWDIDIDDNVRTISRYNKPVMTITAHDNKLLTLDHHLMKMTIDIKTLQRVALP